MVEISFGEGRKWLKMKVSRINMRYCNQRRLCGRVSLGRAGPAFVGGRKRKSIKDLEDGWKMALEI